MIQFDERWIGPHGIGRFAAEMSARIEHRALAIDGRPSSALDPIRLTLALQRSDATAFFSPGYNAPLWSSVPFVFAVHDLNHIDRPENSSLAKRVFYEHVLKRACRRARRVVTVSEFARQRICDWSGVTPARVVNVGNGVGEAFHPEVEPYRPGYDYVLCVSNRRLHKNEPRVVAAFAAAGLPAATRLVFTGPAEAGIVAQVAAAGLSERTVFLGTVAEPQLPGVYRGALALLFPSLYEGFGLPVLEAFACATPVVTSNVTSLPEIAGDAALQVDPLSVAAIAAALTRVVHDGALRERLRGRGLVRARTFSWSSVATRLAAVLDATAGSGTAAR